MHELVMRISDPELCYVFARNARRNGRPELALQAHRRAVDLRAEAYPTTCDVERAAARAVFAYEEALSFAKGKRTRATGTWQMVNRFGVIAAVERRAHSRGAEDIGAILQELGMEDYSFDAVRAAYPEVFDTADDQAAA
jgi:hypothetical protein